ncbi:unnamed protein product [Prorocentrum cordatum]|uniref:Ubiquitinyl hydrolase 1 n=1 Tax=Prorocentrum cordatum TaxID=2364126 RepID=A0ABN9Y990_9DINO|nr:unnamed protein product [Polarella glacialis]
MTVGPPEVEGAAQRIGRALGGGLCCPFDHGAASPLEEFYDPLMVGALQAHLISEEPPMWVIDAPPQTEPAAESDVVGWIRPFIEYVEEQTGAEALWEPFNTKNALHQPPERCWVESRAPMGGGPAEKLAGLQAFLRLASGGGTTFMDKGHRFAAKRYPHAGVPEGAESVGEAGAECYAAEAQHIDRLQRCPDNAQPEEGEAKLYGEPTHFTLVVGFDDATGGTFFPHGRLLPGLAARPEGVSQGTRGGISGSSMRGRALLWSNHRGSVDPASGKAVPLLASLHQSVLKGPAGGNSREPRRVCIFGWAQEGRKWERSGFHECLEYEPPKVRAEFFGRTMLQELQGWEDGQRGREVKHHLKNPEVQREIQEGLANNTLSQQTRNWLAEYGYTDRSEVYQLMIEHMADGLFSWSFLTLGGNCKHSFRVPCKSMKLSELVTRLKENFPVEPKVVVSRVEALDHLTRKKIENPQRLVQQGEQVIIVIKTMDMPKMTVSSGTQTASTGSDATGSQPAPKAAAQSTAASSTGYPAPPGAAAAGGGRPGGPLPDAMVGRVKTESAASGSSQPSAALSPSGGSAAANAAEKGRASLRKANTEHFTPKQLDIDVKSSKSGSDERPQIGSDERPQIGSDPPASSSRSPALGRSRTTALTALLGYRKSNSGASNAGK